VTVCLVCDVIRMWSVCFRKKVRDFRDKLNWTVKIEGASAISSSDCESRIHSGKWTKIGMPTDSTTTMKIIFIYAKMFQKSFRTNYTFLFTGMNEGWHENITIFNQCRALFTIWLYIYSYNGRAFSSTAARAWNSLPTAVQSSESLDIFRHRLKTELFERSYNWHRTCQTTLLLRNSLSLSRSFLLWLQAWSLSTIMLLWHSFLIIIIIIIIN